MALRKDLSNREKCKKGRGYEKECCVREKREGGVGGEETEVEGEREVGEEADTYTATHSNINFQPVLALNTTVLEVQRFMTMF